MNDGFYRYLMLGLAGLAILGVIIYFSYDTDKISDKAPGIFQENKDGEADIHAETPKINSAFTPAPALPGQIKPEGACFGTITKSTTIGEFYKIDAPQRNSMRDYDIAGRPIRITGLILDRNCRAIEFARIEFWQTDGNGQYDNIGYDLRGYQLSNSDGEYLLETVIPGGFSGRAPSINVKINTRSGKELTTHLFFPENEKNESDPEYSPLLEVSTEQGDGILLGKFNFVLDI